MYGGMEVVGFSPNLGRAVVDHCRKYAILHWRVWRRAWQSSWAMSWPCGDRAGIPVASVGVVSSPVEGPSCSTWRRLEGPAGGGLDLVKAQAAFEGHAHAD